MKARSTRLAVEQIEGRLVPSTVAYGDFNNDGLVNQDGLGDMAVITSPTTVTVSLLNPNGTYTVSAILSVPKSLPMGGVSVGDYNGDGNLDISSGGYAANHIYSHTWLGNGDGTFDARNTQRSSNTKWWV